MIILLLASYLERTLNTEFSDLGNKIKTYVMIKTLNKLTEL
ncbi:hypothetical protein BTN50_2036 [Candidatus Enterovibrio altilux]|uniref:Uncharacterized protein n=1 Tax=Candidatus Enterovibrio altilux TaxID=1927128 RepID=A0A291BBQ2_9GAMM|nr:hypothetical protein BTN50_2036 [Candidatus Enterovibrio luxaltus]